MDDGTYGTEPGKQLHSEPPYEGAICRFCDKSHRDRSDDDRTCLCTPGDCAEALRQYRERTEETEI